MEEFLTRVLPVMRKRARTQSAQGTTGGAAAVGAEEGAAAAAPPTAATGITPDAAEAACPASRETMAQQPQPVQVHVHEQVQVLEGLMGMVRDELRATRAAVVDAVRDELRETRAAVVDAVRDELRETRATVVDAVRDELRETRATVVDAVWDELRETRVTVVDAVRDDLRQRRPAVVDTVRDELRETRPAVVEAMQTVIDEQCRTQRLQTALQLSKKFSFYRFRGMHSPRLGDDSMVAQVLMDAMRGEETDVTAYVTDFLDDGMPSGQQCTRLANHIHSLTGIQPQIEEVPDEGRPFTRPIKYIMRL
ncbi:hypothetical protein Vretifemale_13933 [Volvox reticuliferus]|uniref:Uncharacterized protein n=1 Tax=Volvox reticuliferus TaxID=1737510 RepID=A0A8J4CNZ7_9CHLO|nr:hypothetical protein Vretifemale_13933 [Volvox reticuliferus]